MPRSREPPIEYEPQSAPQSPAPTLSKTRKTSESGIIIRAKPVDGADTSSSRVTRGSLKRALTEDNEEELLPAKRVQKIRYEHIGIERPVPLLPPIIHYGMTAGHFFDLTFLYETRGMPRWEKKHLRREDTYNSVWNAVDWLIERKVDAEPLTKPDLSTHCVHN